MSKREGDDEGEIEQKNEDELVRALDKAEDGSYTFLIGAGVSRPSPAEIPTAAELIAEFKKDRFEDVDSDQSLEEWAENYQEVPEDKAYGFWFSEVHPTPGNRRERIRDMVDNPEVEPPFGQIVLASMMDDGIISHTFTPNFDDLLFDAFYGFSEQRPLFVDHEAKAKQFIMSGDRPAIVKLHGDYLHYTQNTAGETANLDPNIKDRFQQSLGEYGMVVIGYGGRDDSIMSVLEAEESFSEYGLFWCVREVDRVPERVKDLLANSENAYLVEIEGSESFFKKLWTKIERVELPQPGDIMEQAVNRREMIKSRMEEVEGQSTPEGYELDARKSAPSRIWNAMNMVEKGKHERAIEILDEVIEHNPQIPKAYSERAIAKYKKNEYKAAIEDYNKAIEFDPDSKGAYYNRGKAKRDIGETEAAIEDYNRAIELDPDFAKAYLNRGNAKRDMGETDPAIENYNKAIELDPDLIKAYNARGKIKSKIGEAEAAIEDYNKVIERDKTATSTYLNRSEAKILAGNYESAQIDAHVAYSHGESADEKTKSLLLVLISSLLLDRDIQSKEEEYRALCKEEFSTSWNFQELDTWLKEAEIAEKKRERINELIDLLREHKGD